MATKITRKDLRQDDAFEQVGFDAQEWLEAHWRSVAAAAGAVLALVALAAGWNWWSQRQAEAAGRVVAEGLRLFRPASSPGAPGQPAVTPAPDYAQALTLFEEAERAGGRRAIGVVASFYRGATLVELRRAGEAVAILEGVVEAAPDELLRENAQLMLARAAEEAGDLDRAVAVLGELSRKPSAALPQDTALYRLGLVLEKAGKAEEARQAWQSLTDRFPQSPLAAEARSLLARGGVAGAAPAGR